MTEAPQITARSWAMVATLGLVWGGTFLFIEVALRGITPFWLAAARISFAALLTLSIWRFLGGKLFLTQDRPWAALAFVSAFSTAVPFMLLSWGQQYVTSGFAGVSMAAVALMVLPLAHVMVPGEQMTARRALGFVIGFVGVCILIGGQAFTSSGVANEGWGRLACLGAACCYALSSVVMRRLPPIDAIGLSAIPLLIGACIVVPTAWVFEGPPPLPDRQTLFVLAILGLIPTAAANLLRVLVIRSAGPVFMSLTNYQVPLWSVILGAVFLSEPLPPSLLLALGMILSGVALSQWGGAEAVVRALKHSLAALHGLPQVQCLTRGLHVMHPQDLYALRHCIQGDGHRTKHPLPRRIDARERANKALARGAKQDGTAQGVKQADPVQDRKVMRQGFAKADPGVHGDLVVRQAARDQILDLLFQKIIYVQQHVFVLRIVLHGLRRAKRMHHTDSTLVPKAQVTHFRIKRQPRDIVNDHCACLQGRLRDIRFACVNRDGHIMALRNGGNNGPRARDFLGIFDRDGTGAGAFAANIQNIGPLRDQAACAMYGLIRFLVQPAIRKAVRGDIDDAHDLWGIERQTGKAIA